MASKYSRSQVKRMVAVALQIQTRTGQAKARLARSGIARPEKVRSCSARRRPAKLASTRNYPRITFRRMVRRLDCGHREAAGPVITSTKISSLSRRNTSIMTFPKLYELNINYLE